MNGEAKTALLTISEQPTLPLVMQLILLAVLLLMFVLMLFRVFRPKKGHTKGGRKNK